MVTFAFKNRQQSAAVCSILVLLLAGCGNGLNLASVTGQVTKDGKPQPKMWVEFVPIDGGRPAEARTDQKGRYELSYSGTEKGAKIGRHRVRIMSGGDVDSRDNELSPRKQVHTAEVEVESGSNEFDFKIDS
jgi:hypothetical protein